LNRILYLFIAAIIVLTCASGCAEHNEAQERIVDYNENGEIQEVLEDRTETDEIDASHEFALYVGDDYYPVDDHYVLKSILDNEHSIDTAEDFPYPSGTIHYGDGLQISAFNVNDERGQGEVIYHITATKEGITPRGIGIGDTLTDLRAAYSELKYEADWVSDHDGPTFNRVYIFAPEDSRTYIAFFLNNKEIVMIEVARAFDFVPGQHLDRENILGQTNVIKETNDSSPKEASHKYLYTNEAGEEEILLEIYSGHIEEADIDEDGITELVVHLPGPLMSLRIYDWVDGEISYVDVNEVLGSKWSSSLSSAGNVKRQYLTHIQAGFENNDGTQRLEVYKFKDLQPVYVGPLSDVIQL